MRAVSLHLAMVSDYKEAAARLMKVNGDMSDTGLRSALILEQAANLYGQSGSIRKSAFHMVLAGHTFNKLQFKKLALHCYSTVVFLYKEKRWYHIIDHFHFTMARQAFGLGFLPESMANFISLLNSFAIVDKRTSIQAERETTYLKEFLFVVRNWIEKCTPSEEEKAVDLHIPTMAPEVAVLLPDELAGATASATQAPAVADEKPSTPHVPWENLGDKLVKALSVEDRLELQWRNKREEKVFNSLQRVTAVGAEVCVEMVLTNPMRVKLELSHARLGGELVETASQEQGEKAAVDSNSELVEFIEETIVLGPLESKRIRLIAIPKAEGLLKIQHLTWNLFDQVLCSRPLQVKGRRLRATLEQRASAGGVYSADKRLELKVRSRVPRIRARIENWPASSEAPLLLGELRSCTLVLEAQGAAGDGSAAKSLRIATSHPAFMVCSAPEAESDAATMEGEVLVYNGGLQGEVRLPIALRADAVGRHAVRVAILAEAAQDASKSIPKSELRQWVTLQEQLTVQPSISCTVVQSPSLQDTERFLFSFAMENKSVDTIEVCRVRCAVGNQQSILEECVQTGASRHQAGPGQLVHLLFAFQRGGNLSSEAHLDVTTERRQLLQASRSASVETLTERGKKTSAEDHVDLIVEWSTLQGQKGEVYLLQVPYDTPTGSASQSQCPLALHLLAPESATLSPDLLVPVTLCVRNASNAGAVSFFFVAEASQDFVWLGCERSEVIQLDSQATHRATLHAHFPAAGIFNLNKFRVHVVRSASPSGRSTEQAPLTLALPVDKLIHIKEP